MSSLQQKLIKIADVFAQQSYYVTKFLPREELFGITSQIRRASISVPCNIIEGFARDGWGKNKKELIRFLEIAYGSLSETRYLIRFVEVEYKIDKVCVSDTLESAEELSRLLFTFIKSLKKGR